MKDVQKIFNNILDHKYDTDIPYTSNDRYVQRSRRVDIGRLRQEFRTDLETEFGIADHPMAEQIFEYAWDKEHSMGLSEVAATYSELVEMLA